MAVNPMQRKARNSFLLGMVVALLITGVIIVLLFLQLKQVKDEQAKQMSLLVNVYKLNQDVKSGQVLTEDMFTTETVNKTLIPSNATSVLDVIDSWFLQTKDGERVFTDEKGLYLAKSDSIIEITTKNGEYYRNINGKDEKVTLRIDPIVDDQGAFVVDADGEDSVTRVYQEASTGEYYTYQLESNVMSTGNNRKRIKTYLELTNVPVIAKVNMNANTVITPDLVVQSDAKITDDVRREEYNSIVLPLDLMTDDYIDVRLLLPNGQNFIVVSKSQVEIPQNADETFVPDTIWINLREDEILSLSSAIVEAYGIPGAKLYATKYAEPGMQNASIPTYTPNAETSKLIEINPNIVKEAQAELAARYTQAAKDLRNQYLQEEINQETTYDSNVQTGMDESIVNSNTARDEYIDSLGY